MRSYLDFEQSIAELEIKINELTAIAAKGDVSINEEISVLQTKMSKMLTSVYSNLNPWQKVLVARHSERPHFLDYINKLIIDFTPLAGDRSFGEDRAIIGGFGYFEDNVVCVIGHEKGHDTDSRIKHNFGMSKPEGYRKAIRLLSLADKFNIPVISLIDTAGAFPGIDAEQRGQAEAIARSIDTCLNLSVINIAVIIGEGGSGGALALAAANYVMMLEHSIYSVASPEASASILWRDANKKEEAAMNMKITAADLLKFNIIDEIIEEPIGGAHRDHDEAIANTKRAISNALSLMGKLPIDSIKNHRAEKFLKMGRIV